MRNRPQAGVGADADQSAHSPAQQAAPSRPLCFVLMPFGRKPDAAGHTVDFDAVYEELLQPAILDAGMEPLRADEELAGGIIHKPMFERPAKGTV
jgi:hypothetical protein